MRERIANVQKTPRRKTRRWDVEKLHKDAARRDEYKKMWDLKLKQKIEGEETVGSVQKRREQLEQAIKATAEEIIGETNYKKNEEWFNEDSATYIGEKNRARQKMLQKETRSDYEEYQEWRWQTNGICTRKKRENMKK